MNTAKEPQSPCVSICALDRDDICVGCLRSGTEIARWGQMTTSEKRSVLKKVAQREADSSLTFNLRTP